MTLGSRMRHLLEHLLGFPDTPEALLHVTLTSYTTYVLQAMYPRYKNDEVARKLMKEARRRNRNDDEEQETDDENTHDSEDPDNEWIFVGRGCFSRVVLDEAQKAKNVRSLITAHRDLRHILQARVAKAVSVEESGLIFPKFHIFPCTASIIRAPTLCSHQQSNSRSLLLTKAYSHSDGQRRSQMFCRHHLVRIAECPAKHHLWQLPKAHRLPRTSPTQGRSQLLLR